MSAPPPPPTRTSHPRVLKAAQLTKWVICAAVGGGLVALHNTPSLLLVTGALGNAAGTKLLKRALNVPRPDTAASRTKTSAGMPSSHASSLAFFASVGCAASGGAPPALVGLLASMLAASWRVGAGFHTWPQVVVGFAWGGAMAVLWVRLAMPALTPGMDAAMSVVGPWPLTACIAGFGVSAVLAKDLIQMRWRRRS